MIIKPNMLSTRRMYVFQEFDSVKIQGYLNGKWYLIEKNNNGHFPWYRIEEKWTINKCPINLTDGYLDAYYRLATKEELEQIEFEETYVR